MMDNYGKKTGPSCSELTMLLVNLSLIIKYGINVNIFAEKKKRVAFAKAAPIFSAKIPVN